MLSIAPTRLQPGDTPFPALTRRDALAGFLAAGATTRLHGQPKPEEFEVVVFGATPAGVLASVAAARVGARVALVEPASWVGGDFYTGVCHAEELPGDRRRLVGGICQEFLERASPLKGRQGVVPQWLPATAQRALRELLAGANVSVRLQAALETVQVERGRIRALRLADATELRARVFVDASAEGDLLAAAKVPYTLGREPSSRFGESLAGVHPAAAAITVSPFDEQGLLPGLLPGSPGGAQSGDGGFASFQLRAVLTANQAIRVPLQPPAGFDPRRFELLGRCAAVGLVKTLQDLFEWKPLAGDRVALAESPGALLSLGMPGAAQGYLEGAAADRSRIYRLHRDHTQGLLWFLRTDRRMPAAIRDPLRNLGLCADLWPESGHWPPALELRESRRMQGEVVINQRDLEDRRRKTDSVSLGLHPLRCPVVGRYPAGKDAFRLEGAFARTLPLYEIPWLSLTPRRIHADNLLVPVCLSASHVAWHSLRAQQTRMALGEVAGVAAALAADAAKAVQDLDPTILQAKLRRVGLLIDLPRGNG